MAEIVSSGLNEIKTEDENYQELWEQVENNSAFRVNFNEFVTDLLLFGFGAFKVYFDKGKNAPSVRWYSYPDCRFKRDADKTVHEVTFITAIKEGKYEVHEIYKRGAIEVKVFKKDSDRELLPSMYPSEALPFKENECTWEGDFSLAVPVAWKYSKRHNGYPEGVLMSKFEIFDFIDECFSKLPEEMRKAAIHTYIPDSMLLNPSAPPNPFDNRFIKTAGSEKQNAEDKITVSSEQLQYQAYYDSYMMGVDEAIKKYMSRYTLGYDTSRTENADAQREKEKTTLYTRRNVINIVSRAIEQLVRTSIAAQQTAQNTFNPDVLDLGVSVDFDEYAAPDMDSVVTTVAKAVNLMSIEARVEELWGNSKTEEWKQEEIKRLKIEQGLVSGIETQVMDYDE